MGKRQLFNYQLKGILDQIIFQPAKGGDLVTERLYINKIIFERTLKKESYLNHLPAVRHLNDKGELKFNKKVTIFVGENGTGKSTLIEAIAVAFGFNPEGGSRNFNFSTNASHSELWEHLILEKQDFPKDGFFLRAESFYNVASNIEELDKQPAASGFIIEGYGGISLHKQSHGESFMSLVQNRFGKNGLYILDEPEAALSPTKLLTLMAEINQLVKSNSQFIIATHSPILMAFPNAEIYEFSDKGINLVDYTQTEHYKVTKAFLSTPERMLEMILE